MNPALKKTVHILLYVLALATLWVAMGLGLQYHITVGPFNVATILLFAAPGIAIVNTLWIFWPKQQVR